MNRFLTSLPDRFHESRPTCIVVGAGDMGSYTPTPAPDDLVIAADGGYCRLREAGVRCDLLIGDLDSLPRETVVNTETHRYNPIKDDTDTMLAVRYALENGCTRFLLFGMFGGRFDHTLGFLQTMAFLGEAGAHAYAFEQTPDGKHSSYVTALKNGTLTFPNTARGYLSLTAWGGEAHGVTLRNLKYPLSNASLSPSLPLGISNEFLEARAASVTVENGLLLAVKPL